jgi:hypothetical protein
MNMNALSSETIEFPPQFSSYDEITQQNITNYLFQLTPIQKKAYVIAKEHLGSSFNVIKSNGYVKWLKNKK